MTMYRVRSQTKDGYPDSHGYYETREAAEECIADCGASSCNRETKYWIVTVN